MVNLGLGYLLVLDLSRFPEEAENASSLVTCCAIAKLDDILGKVTVCGCGGTGRHARLRGVWLTPCEFESRHPHFDTFLTKNNPLSSASDGEQGCNPHFAIAIEYDRNCR